MNLYFKAILLGKYITANRQAILSFQVISWQKDNMVLTQKIRYPEGAGTLLVANTPDKNGIW
jgi:hypothetical protein